MKIHHSQFIMSLFGTAVGILVMSLLFMTAASYLAVPKTYPQALAAPIK